MYSQTIEIRFDQILVLAQRMQNTAALLGQQSEMIADHCREVKTVWKGSNAELFLKKECTLYGQILEQVKAAERMVRQLEQQAGMMYGAELSARALARQRTY